MARARLSCDLSWPMSWPMPYSNVLEGRWRHFGSSSFWIVRTGIIKVWGFISTRIGSVFALLPFSPILLPFLKYRSATFLFGDLLQYLKILLLHSPRLATMGIPVEDFIADQSGNLELLCRSCCFALLGSVLSTAKSKPGHHKKRRSATATDPDPLHSN